MTKTNESEGKGKETAKAPKERRLSNESLGVKLLKEKADEAAILKAYTEVYKLKGVTDKKFIAGRAKIYMSIAAKRITIKK